MLDMFPENDNTIITIELMFAGINMFLARLRLIIIKYSLFIITIIISLKGNIRHKNNKIDCKQSNSRLPASCIYFVVLLTTNCLFKMQKNENHFQNIKRRMENTSLQITK